MVSSQTSGLVMAFLWSDNVVTRTSVLLCPVLLSRGLYMICALNSWGLGSHFKVWDVVVPEAVVPSPLLINCYNLEGSW